MNKTELNKILADLRADRPGLIANDPNVGRPVHVSDIGCYDIEFVDGNGIYLGTYADRMGAIMVYNPKDGEVWPFLHDTGDKVEFTD